MVSLIISCQISGYKEVQVTREDIYPGYGCWEMETLTHWPLGDLVAILKVSFKNELYGIVAWELVVKIVLWWMPQKLTNEKLGLWGFLWWAPSAKRKDHLWSALDGAVLGFTQIMAYLVHNMSRSQLYFDFGWLFFFRSVTFWQVYSWHIFWLTCYCSIDNDSNV